MLIKKITFGLACLLLPALLVLNIYQRKEIKRYSDSIPPESAEENNQTAVTFVKENAAQKNIAKSTAMDDNTPGDNEFEELSYHLEAAQEELDMLNEQISAEKAEKAESRKADLERQKNIIRSSSYKRSQLKYFENEYKNILMELDLSPEELNRLKEIWFVKNSGSYEIYLDIMGVITPSEDKRAEFEQRYSEIYEAYERNLRALLGENDYERYMGYEDTQSERAYVKNFMETLDSTERLSEDERQRLVEAMHEEAMIIDPGYDKYKVVFPSDRYDDKEIASAVDSMVRLDEAYIRAAQYVMSPSQMEKFKEYFEERHRGYESYMKAQALE